MGRREGKTARERLGKLQLGTVVSNIGLGDRLSQCLDRSQDWLLHTAAAPEQAAAQLGKTGGGPGRLSVADPGQLK